VLYQWWCASALDKQNIMDANLVFCDVCLLFQV
jgi:hypothetical protein